MKKNLSLIFKVFFLSIFIFNFIYAKDNRDKKNDFKINILTLNINGINLGDNIVYIKGKDLYIKNFLLEKINLEKVPKKYITKINKQYYYCITCLDKVSVEMNYNLLSANIKVPPKFFKKKEININKNKINFVKSRGFVLSYDLNFRKSDYNKIINAYLKTNYFFDEKNFFSDFVLKYSKLEKKFLRLNTTLKIQDIDNIRIIEIGDTYYTSEYINYGLRVGGIKIGTDFSLRPDIITYPLPEFSGTIELPSSVDIFIKNARVFSERLKPGPFEIKDLPVISPEGEMIIIIRDILGKEKIIKVPYFTHPELLKDNLSKYSLIFGFLRKKYLEKNFNYSKPVLNFDYKKGITNELTLGTSLFFQSKDGGDIGLRIYYLIKHIGLISPFVVVSYDNINSRYGSRYGLSYNKSLSLLNLGFNFFNSSKYFFQPANLSYKEKNYYSIFTGLHLPKIGSISLSYVNRGYFNKGNENNINISYYKTFFKRLNLVFSYNIYKTYKKEESFRISLSLPLGNSHSSNINYQRNKEDEVYNFSIYNSKSNENLNYKLSLDKSQDYYRLFTNLRYNLKYTETYADIDYISNNYKNEISYIIGFRGDIIFINNQLFMRRKSYNSFGILKIDPPVKNALIVVNNRKIGKTDENGILFIPTLYPYNKNEIKIDPSSLDMKTYIEKNIITFVPYKDHGYIIKFKSKKMNSVRLKVKFKNIKPPPPGSRFYVDGKRVGILGFKGKAFIENITEGKHVIEIEYEEGVCSFKVNIDRTILEKTVPFIGEYKCEPIKYK